MSIPTLLIKGNLVIPGADPDEQKKLKYIVPINYIVSWIKSRLDKSGINNRVVIIKSETASGKSTLLPAELYREIIKPTKNGPGLIITQPRIITTIKNVGQIMEHYSNLFKIGENIGWSTKYNKLKAKQLSVTSALIGTLLQELRSSTDAEIMSKYRIIIIDETHERNIQTDIAIMLLKQFLLRNSTDPNTPFVIFLSATIEPEIFLKFFNLDARTNFIQCIGTRAGITEMWNWNEGRVVNNYPRAVADIVGRIMRENQNDPPNQSDIIVFVPGIYEFDLVQSWLNKVNKELEKEIGQVFNILKIDGISVKNQTEDFKKVDIIPLKNQIKIINGRAYVPRRRVILSTTVAETGLTLASLKYVIDVGFKRDVEFEPNFSISCLVNKPAPKSRIHQRRGRVGRNFPGVFYPLYPKYIYEKLPDKQLAQILTNDNMPIFLDIIAAQISGKKLLGEDDPDFKIQDLDMLELPSPDNIARCICHLYTIGLISPKISQSEVNINWWSTHISQQKKIYTVEKSIERGPCFSNEYRFGLTSLGKLVIKLSQVTPESARMILGGYNWGCSILDLVTIAAYLSIDKREIKRNIRESLKWYEIYKQGFPNYVVLGAGYFKLRIMIQDDFIDGLILYNAMKTFVSKRRSTISSRDVDEWCETIGLDTMTFYSFIRERDNIIEQMLSFNFSLFINENNSLLNAVPHNFMDIITRLKYCIYEGYRCNLIRRIDDSSSSTHNYFTNERLAVRVPPLVDKMVLEESNEKEYEKYNIGRPEFILYKSLDLKHDKKNNLYFARVDTISVCDGYIGGIDRDYL